MKKPIRCVPLALVLLLIIGTLSACGQKGDLYLPDPAATPQSPTSP